MTHKDKKERIRNISPDQYPKEWLMCEEERQNIKCAEAEAVKKVEAILKSLEE